MKPLAVEVIEAIIVYVDSPKDLLSLALTCHLFGNMIVPRHIQLRVIRCVPIQAIGLLKALIKDRALASNVRQLEIQAPPLLSQPAWRPSPRIPPFLLKETTWSSGNDKEDLQPEGDDAFGKARAAQRLLIEALKNMTRLQCFTWDDHDVLINASTDNRGEDIWTALKGCKTLRKLIVKEPYSIHNTQHQKISDSKLFDITGLLYVSYQATCASNEEVQKHTTGLTRMLSSGCPDLEVLSLAIRVQSFFPFDPLPIIGSLLTSRQWPKLRSFRMTGTQCDAESASQFLIAHPRLEELRVDEKFFHRHGEEIALPPGVLPNLRVLGGDRGLIYDVLTSDNVTRRPVKYIWAVANYSESSRIVETLMRVPILQRVDVYAADADLTLISRSISWVGFLSDFSDDNSGERSADSWISALTRLPDLVRFHGIPFFQEDDPRNDKVASILGEHCPNLRHLDSWKPKDTYITLYKGSKGQIKWETRKWGE